MEAPRWLEQGLLSSLTWSRSWDGFTRFLCLGSKFLVLIGLLLSLQMLSLWHSGKEAAAQDYQELKIRIAALFLRLRPGTCPSSLRPLSSWLNPVTGPSRFQGWGPHKLILPAGMFRCRSNILPDKKGSRSRSVCLKRAGTQKRGRLQFLILCCPFDWRANSGEQDDPKLPLPK